MLHPVLTGVDGGAKRDPFGNVPDEGQPGVMGRLGQREIGRFVQHRVGLDGGPAFGGDPVHDGPRLVRRVGQEHAGPRPGACIDPGAGEDQTRAKDLARLDPGLQRLLLGDGPERAHVADAGDAVDEVERQRGVRFGRRGEDVHMAVPEPRDQIAAPAVEAGRRSRRDICADVRDQTVTDQHGLARR